MYKYSKVFTHLSIPKPHILPPADFTTTTSHATIKTMDSPSSPPPLSIAIIGAGIAGVILAIALSEHNPNLSLTIYESRREFSGVSAGVGFGPNALKAMALISPKLIAAYDQVKTPNLWPEKDHLWYEFRWADTGKLVLQVESEKGFAHCNSSRVHLLANLAAIVPRTVKVEFGKRVVDVQGSRQVNKPVSQPSAKVF